MIILYSFVMAILSWALYPAIMEGIKYWYPLPKMGMEVMIMMGMTSPIFAILWTIIERLM